MRPLKDDKTRDLQSRWLAMSRILLSCVLAKGNALESLTTIISPDEEPIKMPLSAIDSTMISHNCSPVLKKLRLDLAIDVDEGKKEPTNICDIDADAVIDTLTLHILVLCYLLRKLTALVDLHLTFQNSSVNFFKQFAKATPASSHRCLSLSSISTRRKYLTLFISNCIATLRSLTLELVQFTRKKEYERTIRFLCWNARLEYCELQCLDFESGGISFKPLHRERPEVGRGEGCEIEGEPWLLIGNYSYHFAGDLVLQQNQGDNVRYWLRRAEGNYELDTKWTEGHCWS